jgi:hypothetical protein
VDLEWGGARVGESELPPLCWISNKRPPILCANSHSLVRHATKQGHHALHDLVVGQAPRGGAAGRHARHCRGSGATGARAGTGAARGTALCAWGTAPRSPRRGLPCRTWTGRRAHPATAHARRVAGRGAAGGRLDCMRGQTAGCWTCTTAAHLMQACRLQVAWARGNTVVCSDTSLVTPAEIICHDLCNQNINVGTTLTVRSPLTVTPSSGALERPDATPPRPCVRKPEAPRPCSGSRWHGPRAMHRRRPRRRAPRRRRRLAARPGHHARHTRGRVRQGMCGAMHASVRPCMQPRGSTLHANGGCVALEWQQGSGASFHIALCPYHRPPTGTGTPAWESSRCLTGLTWRRRAPSCTCSGLPTRAVASLTAAFKARHHQQAA